MGAVSYPRDRARDGGVYGRNELLLDLNGDLYVEGEQSADVPISLFLELHLQFLGKLLNALLVSKGVHRSSVERLRVRSLVERLFQPVETAFADIVQPQTGSVTHAGIMHTGVIGVIFGSLKRARAYKLLKQGWGRRGDRADAADRERAKLCTVSAGVCIERGFVESTCAHPMMGVAVPEPPVFSSALALSARGVFAVSP